MTMLRRWVPAGLLLSSVVATSPTILAQTGPTKTGATTTAAKPAAATAKPAAPKGAKPTDPKAGTTPEMMASRPPDTSDPKAATGTPMTDAEKELVRLLDDARKSFKAGQYEKAREFYATAYKQKPDRSTLFLLAQAEAKANKPRDAAEHLELYLREGAGATPEDDRAAAQKLFVEVTSKLGTWTVKVSIDGAEVLLDGKSVGQSPLAAPLFVEPNTHEVEARKEGFLPEKEMAVVAPNTESETMLVMRPAPEEMKSDKPHHEEKPIPIPEPPSPKWRTYGIIGGGALTALGLGLGIGLTVSASGKSDEADAQLAELRRTTPTTYAVCGPNQFQPNQKGCGDLANTLSSQDARANGAVFGFVLAGIGAVGTVGLILLPKLPIGRKLMGMQITPVIGFDRMGGAVTGSF